MIRLRLKPLDPEEMIDMGPRDPGPDWWAEVKRFWNVSDAPRPQCWVPPLLVKLAGGKCQFCQKLEAGQVTPSLFDEEPMNEPTVLGPLAFPCANCGAKQGVKCRNYLGKNKQTCPDRGKPTAECEAPKAKPKQPNLFDEESVGT